MNRFVVLYFFFLVLLFVFLYAPTTEISVKFNEIQTQFTLFLLEWFLQPQQLQGIDIWINPQYKIVITQACNGMIPILFLFASILAYPSAVSHKIIWMLIGYLSFTAVNVLRLLMVVYFVQREGGRDNFYWAHDILGNFLLMILGLLLFFVFIKMRKV
ncbi:MAG: archaeosortase/exosortase family protein [Sulfurovum sp.]|jgi:exosortase/archaeosortase family protein|nr:archaeosortase/exosortase family protein [Sulfurovum sp.]